MSLKSNSANEVDLVVDANGHFARVFYALINDQRNPCDLNSRDDLDKLHDRVHDVMCGGLIDLVSGGSDECIIDPRPTRMVLVWDGENRRDKHRVKPEAYYELLGDMRTNLHNRFCCANVVAPAEADDAVASIAVQSVNEGNLVYVASSDKDLQQLAEQRLRVYSWHKRGWVTPDDICRRWGIHHASHVALYLALCGDAIDKIPGVKGIGPKRFATLYHDSVDKQMSLEEAFFSIEAHLQEEQRDQFNEMLDLTLLDTSLKLSRPSVYSLH